MTRLRIELPERIVYSCDMSVRVTDLNYGNHLANNMVLGLMHEARWRWFRSLGYASELKLDGAGIVMADASVIFQSEAFAGETLTIELRLGSVERSAVNLFYALKERETQRPVAIARTAIVFFNYETRKSTPIPDGVRRTFETCGPGRDSNGVN